MASRDPHDWMWHKAADLVDRAERAHRRLFVLASGTASRPTWEPPADVFESDERLCIVVALPGVEADRVEVLLDRGSIVVQGERRLPASCGNGVVQRLEIPYGRFERHVRLPAGRYELERRELVNGCLVLELAKIF